MADQYSTMLADSDRIDNFNKAIQNAVRPDDVVVDLGCGVGTFAMQAARAGARRVFGVEIDSIVEVADQIARLNDTKVEFIAGDARQISLPEPATLLIFEDYNTGLIDGIGARLLELAREKWVAKDYRVLPQGASLNLAPISSASVHEANYPLGVKKHTAYGFDFKPLIDVADNTLTQLKGTTDLHVLAPPTIVLNHDFMQPLPKKLSTTAEFTIDQSKPLDGVCLWHDLHLNDEISYSNHPDTHALWGQYYFPIPERWDAQQGDSLLVDLSFFDALEDGFWKWRLELRRNGEMVKQYSANTFAGAPLSAHSLQKFDLNQVAKLSDRGKLEAEVLSLVDGSRTVKSICEEMQQRHAQLVWTEIVELVQRQIESR